MNRHFKIVQFLAPWRGRSGFNRFQLDLDNALISPLKPIKCRKMLDKSVKQTDGLLLRPVWPSRKGLVVVNLPEGLKLFPIHGTQILNADTPMDANDPTLRLKVDERLLYRRFEFQTNDMTLVYRDMAGRLVGPQRLATQIFPDEDFSPFARLISMLADEGAKQTLLSDLNRRRFKYSRWLKAISSERSAVAG